MCKNILSISLAAALGMVSLSASALPSFSLRNGYTGEIEIKYSNYESFNGPLAVGSQNYGVVKVSSIVDPNTGDTVWADGDNGAELTGVFNGITIKTVTPAGGGQFIVDSTGGLLDVFINPLGSFSAAGGFAQGAVTGYTDILGCLPNQLCYDGISNVAGGGVFLNLAFVPVGIVADPTITVNGTFNSLTTPLTGTAQGYLSVTGGPWAVHFDTDGELGGSDMFNQNSFCTPGQTGCASLASAGGAPPAGWQLRSNDPLRANYIPEPASLTLLGIGLFGMGLIARRRKV